MKKFINLLPEEEKKLVRKEYVVRRRIVSFALILVVFLIAIGMLVPSYLIARSNLASSENQLNTVRATSNEDDVKKLSDTIERTARDLVLFESDVKNSSASDAIQTLVSARGQSVTITSLLFTRTEKAGFKISVSGVAATREALVSFADRVRTQKTFDQVEVPVSNFAKDRDILFNIQIIEDGNE